MIVEDSQEDFRTTPPNVKVTAAAQLYRAAAVFTAGLGAAFPDAEVATM